MYSSRPSKILIIDDDVELVTLLVDYFTLEGFEATPAHTGLEGLQALQAKEFDLIVLDVMMPGISGTETLQRIREKWRTPVLMLTARGDPVDRILGLELGADDYVPKPCSPRELVARIRAIYNGAVIPLTGTELSLLEMLARSVGQPVAKADIYPRILGRPMGRYDRAIDVHISAIRHKLAEAGVTDIAIESVRGVGYQLVQQLA